jgi:hypothetical protein
MSAVLKFKPQATYAGGWEYRTNVAERVPGARYQLPRASVKVTAAGLRHWLRQLGMNERALCSVLDMDLEKIEKWNSGEPLASFLGTIIECAEGTPYDVAAYVGGKREEMRK